jgi:hypothetical protein
VILTKGHSMGLDQYTYLVEKSTGIEEELDYWRKNNQLQGWFEKNTGIENCQNIYLTTEMCDKLIEDIKAGLPSTEGFFYGNYSMDQEQMKQLIQTFEDYKSIIDDEDTQIYYTCWY